MKQIALLLSTCVILHAQSFAQMKKKDMKLDSTFQSKADRMEVKMGMQMTGKLWNYKFGPYHLTENKMYGNKEKETSNFFGTNSTVTSKHKFRFELSDDQQNSAKVEGSIQNDITSLHAIPISQHLSIGESGIAGSKRNFFATITPNGDTVAWKLVLVEQTNSPWIAVLTNGVRTIEITRLFEFEDGKVPFAGISAGCELKENNQIIGAVQYFGNRYNNNVVWLLSSMDAKEKCLIAAALTALMASAHNGQEALENSMNN